ncbi:MAG TPA: DUF2207 domain-containing protein [Thermoanaerobaculia bacterium]|nr:DUF2207 domain-containing protein [Thermoanaerobaculia bacterium]
MNTRASIAAGLLAAAIPFAASARTLHWRSLEVRATLDRDGLLHVSERQNMIFDGEWNGGERKFRVEPGQQLTFDGMARIDARSGESVPLVDGDLSQVDHFAFVDAKTLRWRSRLPSDPPFANTEIDYVLDYKLSGVLEERGGKYRLAHDFAFSDRDGPIDRFTLDFTLDPRWKPEGAFPGRWEAGPLAPGRGFVVRATLASAGGASPSAVRRIPLLADRRLATLLLAAAILLFGLHYWLHDRARGRFRPLPPLSSVDARWLAENVFDILPEEVGAALDDDVGAPEVSAVLARLVAEKKLKSETVPSPLGSKRTLRLTRIAPLSSFSGYERKLVDGLFFGEESVTPEEVRSHYKSSGFNPSKLIAADIKAQLAGKGAFAETAAPPGKLRSLLFFAAAVAFGIATLRHPIPAADPRAAFVFLFASAFLALAGISLAKRASETFTAWNGYLLAGIALLLGPWIIVGRVMPADYSPTTFAAITCMTLMYVSSAFHMAMSRDGTARMEARRRIATARRWFREQLRQPRPALEDAWFPWMLALGLGSGVDRWSKSFAGESRSAGGGFSGSSGSSSSSGGGWTGGGGSFGGAGASGSWAAAVGGFSAGVAAPSSSGGGGGGSSGGGGGGGW